MAGKRDPSLVPLSHDHHHGLVRSFRIRKAVREGGDLAAERATTSAFHESDLAPHFRAEEEALVPALRETGAVSEKAIATLLEEHRTLGAMAGELARGDGDLAAFANLLERHIRTEEREIFPAYEARVAAPRRAEVGAALLRILGR
jgi:iron-sulfur cluster repair protein YtfE (RIC family)